MLHDLAELILTLASLTAVFLSLQARFNTRLTCRRQLGFAIASVVLPYTTAVWSLAGAASGQGVDDLAFAALWFTQAGISMWVNRRVFEVVGQ